MIDHHVHLGYDEKTHFSLIPEELSKRLDRFGLEGAIIFSCPNVSLKNKNPFEEGNRLVFEASRRDKRLIPFMFIHPILDEFSYIQSSQRSFMGFKLYPKTTGMEYDYRDLNKDVKGVLDEIRKPLLFHTGSKEGHRIMDLIHFIRDTSNRCILVHCGDLIDEDLRAAAELPNTIIDISPMATMIERGFYTGSKNRDKKLKILTADYIIDYLIWLFGPERIVWGSDAPWCDYLIKGGYKREVEILRKMERKGLKNSIF